MENSEEKIQKDMRELKASLLKEIAVLQKKVVGIDQYLESQAISINESRGMATSTDTEDKSTLSKKHAYPKSADIETKVISIITTKKQAMLLSEVRDEIADNEGAKKDEVLKSFFYHIRKMVADGKLATSKVGDSNKHTFYALPEFLERKRLLLEHMPDKSTWGNLSEERMLELTKKSWIIGE